MYIYIYTHIIYEEYFENCIIFYRSDDSFEILIFEALLELY